MKKIKSPCDACGECKNPDSAFHSCKRWNQWFSQKWRGVNQQGARLILMKEQQKKTQGSNKKCSKKLFQTSRRIGQEAACAFCGKTFIIHQSNQIYCCMDCTRQAVRQKHRKVVSSKTCPVCGKQYIPNSGNRKYCSLECQRNQKKKRYELNTKSWDEVVKKCTEAGCSYGEARLKGII